MFKIYFALIILLIAIVCLNQANALFYFDRANQVNQIKKQICVELNDESLLKREDAMDLYNLCIARLAFLIQNLKDQLSNTLRNRRFIIKRPNNKPMDDEILKISPKLCSQLSDQFHLLSFVDKLLTASQTNNTERL